MSPQGQLVITSLLAIVLMSLHLSDDIVRGYEPGGLNNLIGVAILVVWLYAALQCSARLPGRIVLLLGGLFAAAMPAVHMSGAGVGKVAASPGGLLFVWTLMALGTTGAFALVLSVQGLRRKRTAACGHRDD